jgi:hypothetical protein
MLYLYPMNKRPTPQDHLINAIFTVIIALMLAILASSCRPRMDVYVNPLLEDVVTGYLERFDQEGIPYRGLRRLSSVDLVSDGLLWYLMDGPTWAVTHVGEDGGAVVSIGNAVVGLYDPCFLEAVVYHEMFHVWAGAPSGHCNAPWCPKILNCCISPDEILSEWGEEARVEYFDYLRNFNRE